MRDSSANISHVPGFPVDAVMPELCSSLARHGRAILTASPGSGKTTRVPLALLGLLPAFGGQNFDVPLLTGKILVLEPRRLAARAAARYMAGLLGEVAGQRVGYRVRLESRVSKETRVELLTEGMFTRRLLADPELSGVSCVIFDEFHERSLQADLGLALCLECTEAFRPDLRLLLMSATLDTGELSRFLGDCPVIETKGRNWPVTVRYAGREQSAGPGISLSELAGKTALAVRQALDEESGSILVFLPGQAEIRHTAELLEKLPDNTDIYPLYGDLPFREQDAAIAPPPAGRRKVVLATDLAQTSLTIEGVRIVIDAGLARSPRFEPATGMSRLATSRLTQDAADQRAGRAGRLEPGLCFRLWPEQEVLFPQARPEILDADLAPLYLDTLAWGSDPAALPWLTPPPEAALQSAAETLLALEAARAIPDSGASPELYPDSQSKSQPESGSCAQAEGQAVPQPEPCPKLFSGTQRRLAITPHGEKLARLPLHPRLAHMVLRAAALEAANQGTDLPSLAACLAALVSERDPLRKNGAGEVSADIRLRLPLLQRPENKRLKAAAEQIHRLSGLKSVFRLPYPQEEDFCGMLLSLAWPERIAQRRAAGSFRLASGQGAELPVYDPLASESWLAVASLGGNGANRRMRLAAPIMQADILRLHADKLRLEEEIYWDSQSEAVVCRSATRMGALILEEKPLQASPELDGRAQTALLEGIASMGLNCLPWTKELRQFQARVIMMRKLERLPEPARAEDNGQHLPKDAKNGGQHVWPDLSDDALGAGLAAGTSGNPGASWLSPWLKGITRRTQLSSVNLDAALRALLPWPLPERLEQEAPTRLDLPSGSSAQVDYLPVLHCEPPVLAVKLQEMFGQTDTPLLAGGRVPVMLHLLSPAGRPLQVTGDLRHFWTNAYKQVRAEMRGRYPKHPWPEEPLNAQPTGKTKKRLEAETKKEKSRR